MEPSPSPLSIPYWLQIVPCATWMPSSSARKRRLSAARKPATMLRGRYPPPTISLTSFSPSWMSRFVCARELYIGAKYAPGMNVISSPYWWWYSTTRLRMAT